MNKYMLMGIAFIAGVLTSATVKSYAAKAGVNL
jgi:hypothetical protein